MAPFNKMFVMIPVMLAARKLDSEDANVLHMVRVAYGIVQCLCFVLVAYVYIQATSIAKTLPEGKIYIPQPALPFGVDPNAKKKYTESTYAAHLHSAARSLLGSTFFGVLLTVGFHYYKGMVMGLAIQTVMGPLNLFENAIVRAMLLGNGVQPADRIFEEKLANELSADSDEVVDEHGTSLSVPAIVAAAGKQAKGDKKDGGGASSTSSSSSIEDVLLDTWDQGNKADLGPLMKILNKSNVNYQTKDDQWSPLMILSGLGAKGSVSAIRAVREMGADPSLVDKEGWTALHWAAFHGCLLAAQELSNETSLLKVKDKEGHTPIETARQEKNDDVAAVYEKAVGENKKSK